MAKIKATRSVRRAQPAHRLYKSNRRKKHRKSEPIASAQFVLQERVHPYRRFVEFPIAKGKVAEKVQLFLDEGSQSLTIGFDDDTSLYLLLEPSLTINATFQKDEKGELETLAEWPPIRSA